MEKRINYINPEDANSEEKILLNILEKAKKSEELKNIMLELKTLAIKATDISIYAQRIKRPESLLRTIRVKGAENACDLTGILFGVETNDDIYKIVDKINDKLQPSQHYDLSNSLGIPPYKVVPLCYTILKQLFLKDVDTSIPFEIRIHDKIGILATESNYYLYKKDGISNVKERFELSGKTLDLIRIRASIDSSNSINEIDKEVKEQDIKKKIMENKDIFCKYQEEVYSVFKEYAKNLFKYNNKIKVGHFSFINGNNFADEALNNLDEILYSLFDFYYENADINLSNTNLINMYDRCKYAIEKTKLLTLNSLDHINQGKKFKR